MKMTISGDDVLISRLQNLPKNVRARLTKRALKSGAELILESAKEIVRVLSGALHDGMLVKAKRKRGKFGYTVSTPTRQELAKLQTNASKAEDVYSGAGYYPAVLEFGSSKQVARPYLRPAFENNTAQIIEMAAQDIREALDKRAGIEPVDESDTQDSTDDVAPDAPVHTGKRGGRYRLSRSGNKVYIKQ